MAQKTDLNVAPYYDDFDSTDNFHKVLFRPGFAVQARELTQLQSILQNQIEKHGNNIFKDGIAIAYSPEDFKKKIDHYLSNPEERQAIAHRGRELVKQRHTGFDRAHQIIKYLGMYNLSNSILDKKMELVK